MVRALAWLLAARGLLRVIPRAPRSMLRIGGGEFFIVLADPRRVAEAWKLATASHQFIPLTGARSVYLNPRAMIYATEL